MHTYHSRFIQRYTVVGIVVVLTLFAMLSVIQPMHVAHAVGIHYATASGTGNCSTWINACQLQTALTGAVSGDEIWVAAGTYTPITTTDRTATFQLKNGVALYGGFVGTETARSQRDPAAHITILSGDLNGDDVGFTNNSENSYHVVTGSGTDSTAILDGFTISGGNANDSPGYGGGLYASSGGPTLVNLDFSVNQAARGGGVAYESSSSSLTRVKFDGNSAQAAGGGLYQEVSNLTLIDVTFNDNSADQGGGYYIHTGSTAQLTNVTFSDNQGGNGPDLGGGGIFINGSSPILINVTFSENQAGTTGYGGGIFSYNSNPALTNVTFSGNSAGKGGGMYIYSAYPVIQNTILWGNTATDSGAQIYNAGGTPDVSDSVVQGGYAGTNILTTDPMLGVLGNYGGSTQTIPLLAGSSAIATGNTSVCPATDQRRVPRINPCDIGAYEYVLQTFLPLGIKNH